MNENTENMMQEQETTPAPWEQEQEQEQQEPATISDDDILKALASPSDAVKAALDKMIADAVKKALAGATPRKQPIKTDTLTKEQFAKMTYQERCKLFESNRPLYEKLKGAM